MKKVHNNWKYNVITGGLCSSEFMRQAADESEYTLLIVDDVAQIDLSEESQMRMAHILAESGGSMVYSDYEMNGELMVMGEYMPGSVRDDFQFGPVVMVDTRMLVKAAAEAGDYKYAGWYAVRLMLSSMAPVVHIKESLYSCVLRDTRSEEVRRFDYVNPRNADVQKEFEAAFTEYLKFIGAYLSPDRYIEADYGDDFALEASVVIPVKNRVRTIADAVKSAASQKCDFAYNIIVVDNHSTDGTAQKLAALAKEIPNLIVHTPEATDHGIGGCWNEALAHESCGRFVVQLDSDDIYSGPDTLQRVVDVFRNGNYGMVVGAYTLTDFRLSVLPQGLIAHLEWTDENGRNNALRVNGFGAPRAFATAIARQCPMPDVSYGEDYVAGLRISRTYRVGRIFDSLYLCRRWEGNSDAALPQDKINANNLYKDSARTNEINIRKQFNQR